jgi:transposase
MMSNLNAHTNRAYLDLIIQAGHIPMLRPPYSPHLAPIKRVRVSVGRHFRATYLLVNRIHGDCLRRIS